MIFHQCETFQEDRSIFFYLHLCEFKQKELKMLIIFWPERLWKVFTNSFYTIWNWANNFRAQVWSNLGDLTDVPVLFFEKLVESWDQRLLSRTCMQSIRFQTRLAISLV